MTREQIKSLMREAHRQGNLEGGDPFEGGEVPPAIERSIAAKFESWFKARFPLWGKR